MTIDHSKTRCTSCGGPLTITRLECRECRVTLQGAFEPSSLALLGTEEQVFVTAFLRHHGSIKKMESLFGISYPTVKSRLRSIVATLDRELEADSPNLRVLEALARGEMTVDEALEQLE